MNRKFAVLLLAALILLFGCNNTDYGDFYGGTPVDSAAIQSAASLLTAETVKKADAVITDAAGTRIYFWTPGGDVYHSSPDCSHLNAAKTVLSGAMDEAMKAGKDRACSACCKEP